MMLRFALATSLLVANLLCHRSASAERSALVTDGSTRYVIHHVPAAPASVKLAAHELQRVIAVSTGVTILISTTQADRMICLGDSPTARAAGLDVDTMPEESFRIVTRAGNIYIVGKDTPDGKKTQWNRFSRGTQFGVYEFLERVVGVRWLMPGELGEEIPKREKIVVPEMSVLQQPAFLFRMLGIDPPVVKERLTRQRVSADASYANTACTKVIYTQHSWDWYLPEELRKAHPEWKAVGGEKNKFCTRNPEAVQAFAEGVIQWFDNYLDRWMTSISPSDGQGFCRCEKCSAHIERDAHGVDSFTVNLLDFYNDIARIVAQKRPGKMVAGYAYGRYEYPPKKPIRLEPNLYIEWTPLNYYGLGLYKPGYRQEFEKVAATWAGMTNNIGYQNYCHWHRSEQGAPYAPALSILKFQFPILKRLGYQGVQEFGTSVWAYGGPNNYLLAKLLWDANANVDAIYKEWLQLAYGPGWKPMDRLYQLLDDRFRKFKVMKEPFNYRGDNYEIMCDKVEAIYLPILPKIERLYQEAYKSARTERQRKRLHLFAENMIIFHQNLRKGGYLPRPEQSIFYRSDADFAAFLKQRSSNVYVTVPERLWPKSYVKSTQPQLQPEKRALTIPRLQPGQHAPVIDGTLAPGEWDGAPVADSFSIVGSRALAAQPTTARVAYDDSCLYLAFECAVDDAKSLPADKLRPDDSDVYEGEVVEVLLNCKAGLEYYWHLAVNPATLAGMESAPIPSPTSTGPARPDVATESGLSRLLFLSQASASPPPPANAGASTSAAKAPPAKMGDGSTARGIMRSQDSSSQSALGNGHSTGSEVGKIKSLACIESPRMAELSQ